MLQSVDDQQLVFEFSEWVLRASEEDGLEIFTTTKRKQPLAPDRVLAHLDSISSSLALPYLVFLLGRGDEHAIGDPGVAECDEGLHFQGGRFERFHTRLGKE